MMIARLAIAAPLLLTATTTTTCHASSPLTPGGNSANRNYMPPAPGMPADHQLRPRLEGSMPPISPAMEDQQQDLDAFDVPGEHHVAVEERLSAWRQQQQVSD